jgi:dTDP-4-amino-4,6-dideoxygalactose transaminase
MINYIQNKRMDFDVFKKIISKSELKNQFTNSGPAKKELEQILHKLLKIDDGKSVLCVSNGTLALHTIKLFFQRKKSDFTWVSPSFTFPSCVVGGFKTSIVDIELKSMTLPIKQTKKYDGTIITSLFGTYPENLKELLSYASKNNKKVILDVASSPMTIIDGKNICNFGDYSFGSLHHTKYLGFGEGGFIILPKEEYKEMSSIMAFGYTVEQVVRKFNPLSSNYKMSDVAAAAIIQHLQKLDLDLFLNIQHDFTNKLNSLENSKLFLFNQGLVYGNLPILFKNPQNKKTFVKQGIEVQKYYYPLSTDHNNSMFVYDRIINFPLHTDLTSNDIKKIINSIKEIK